MSSTTMARQCFNSGCAGPEWWAIGDEDAAKYRDCPSCGYPCTLAPAPEFSAEQVMAAVWAEATGATP